MDINNFNCNLVFLKKIGKTSKNCQESIWVMPKTKNNFFAEVTKADNNILLLKHFV